MLLRATKNRDVGEISYQPGERISVVTFKKRDRIIQNSEGLHGVNTATLTTTETLGRTSYVIDTGSNTVYVVRFVSDGLGGLKRYTLEEVEGGIDERIFATS